MNKKLVFLLGERRAGWPRVTQSECRKEQHCEGAEVLMCGQRPVQCADLPSSGLFLLASFFWGRTQTSCRTTRAHPVLGGGVGVGGRGWGETWKTSQRTAPLSSGYFCSFVCFSVPSIQSIFLSVCFCLLSLFSNNLPMTALCMLI